MKKDSFENKGFEWTRFAGLASQWSVALVILLFLGKYLDHLHFLNMNSPLFIWLLPFCFIVLSLVRIIKDTNSNKNK